VKLTGDEHGVAALKELAADNRDYLKFLLTEAQSNSDRAAPFRAKDGEKWELVVHPESGDLEVRRPATG
jgi:hypothetical protein